MATAKNSPRKGILDPFSRRRVRNTNWIYFMGNCNIHLAFTFYPLSNHHATFWSWSQWMFFSSTTTADRIEIEYCEKNRSKYLHKILPKYHYTTPFPPSHCWGFCHCTLACLCLVYSMWHPQVVQRTNPTTIMHTLAQWIYLVGEHNHHWFIFLFILCFYFFAIAKTLLFGFSLLISFFFWIDALWIGSTQRKTANSSSPFMFIWVFILGSAISVQKFVSHPCSSA